VGELAHITAEKDLARAINEIERAESRIAKLGGELTDIDASLAQAAVLEGD